MVYSTITHLAMPSLPPYATKSHGFNHLSSGSLFSFGQACDNNLTVFDKQSVKIFNYTEVSINLLCPPKIQGHRNSASKPLYSVSHHSIHHQLWKQMQPSMPHLFKTTSFFVIAPCFFQQFQPCAKHVKMVSSLFAWINCNSSDQL